MTPTNQGKAPRLLFVKRVRFRAGRIRDFKAPALEELLLQIKDRAPFFRNRHWPRPPAAPDAIQVGTQCQYISSISTREGEDGVYFEVGGYVHGRGEHQLTLDLTGNNADPHITSGPLQDELGRPRAIVTIFRCLALGETLIVENHRGAGGVSVLVRLLTAMFKEHCDPALPGIELVDVTTDNLRREIEAGGGVKSMMIRVIDGAAPQSADRRLPLYLARDSIGGAGKMDVTWQAEDHLDTDDVLETVESALAMDSGLDKIKIKLHDGPDITKLGRFLAKKEIWVTIDRFGFAHYAEVKDALFAYLTELRVSRSGWSLIDLDGYFNASKPIASME